MAAGSKSSLSIYGVIAFPIASQVEETHHAQVPSTSIPMTRHTLQKLHLNHPVRNVVFVKVEQTIQESFWILQDLLTALLLFILPRYIPLASQSQLLYAVTSWDPKFRPFGWFPNSHRSSSLACLDHFSSPWKAQKIEASFDTNLAQQWEKHKQDSLRAALVSVETSMKNVRIFK